MGSPPHEYVVIVGCGRLGAHLAERLSRQGCSVVVVDADEARLSALSVEFGGFRLEGDGTELATLKRAKVDKADRVVAVTGHDNVNLMVAEIAKRIFQVPKVTARVSDTRREAVFRALGIETVCPLTLAAEKLLRGLAQSEVAPS